MEVDQQNQQPLGSLDKPHKLQQIAQGKGTENKRQARYNRYMNNLWAAAAAEKERLSFCKPPVRLELLKMKRTIKIFS
jgi:hypothetical protein